MEMNDRLIGILLKINFRTFSVSLPIVVIVKLEVRMSGLKA